MKQNSRPIVSEVPKPSGVGLDELDGAIESFSAGIADSVAAVIEQTRLVASEHRDYFFDRFQTTPHGVVGPCVKEALSRPRVVIGPELTKRLFDAPGSAGLEVELIQCAERNRLRTAPIRIGLEPRIFTTRQRRCACLG